MCNKRNGFTLIELLSIILILLVIALISVPLVINVIKDSQKSVAERSIEGVIDASKKYCALKMVKNQTLQNDVTIKCNSKTNECKIEENGDILKIEGKLPSGSFKLSSNCIVNPVKETMLLLDGFVFSIKKSLITKITPAGDSKLITSCENDICEIDSFLQGIAMMDLENGTYTFKISDKSYKVELINFTDDVIINENTSFGDDSNEYKTLIVKFHGNLTINSGVNVTANTNNNYTYKKGMYIYVNGTLTNNGTISMTARGTYNLAGEDTILWKNKDNSFEMLPAVGANGGAGRTGSYSGNSGAAGSSRQTGGGGAGAGRTYNSSGTGGSGGKGSTFSGGAGGGGGIGTSASSRTGGTGSSIGGAGGNGSWEGGGAGNPGGTGSAAGGFGTGGLLVIYADTLTNNGMISSNGSNGGNGADEKRTGGGGAGGGSINIFYKNPSKIGTTSAIGGTGGTATYLGGKGGNGSITSCPIISGTCVIDK